MKAEGWGGKLALFVGLVLAWPASLWAGAWTLPQGKFWGKATLFLQTTEEWYIASPEFSGGQLYGKGTRRPYRFEGEYQSRAVFLEGFYGLTERFDIGLQVPYFDQQFADATRSEPPSDAGFSDIRLFAKARFLQKPVIFTFKGGVKMPTGEFRNEDGLIPVGEGQWDYDLVAQVGRSFWPLPLYANAELGYRVRTKNDEIDRDPGDEWFLHAEVGYQLGQRLLVMGKYEMLRSDPAIDFGFKNRSQIKRITYLSPVLLIDLGGSALELGLRYTLSGQNFPAGFQTTAGLSASFGGG
ncbi:MAG: hypothetical protein GKR89_31755 [Candidatus Latescibacteria bacterium]|nr:hypothetical protein [Candidatus Latescibacterota bacterium]